MKVYYARNEKTGEEHFTNSANDLSGFIGCNANYLREILRSGRKSFKGFYISSGEFHRITGKRGGFMKDNYYS